MPTTTPDNIYYADGTTPASLATITATIATSVQEALNVREAHSYSWANSTERSGQTGMSTGDIGYQVDNQIYYRYSGSAWLIWAKAQTTYTPTFTGFTPSASSFTYLISGGVVQIFGRATCSTTLPTGQIVFTLPSGLNLNTTFFATSGNASIIGTGGVDDASTASDFPINVVTRSSTSVAVAAINAAGTYAATVATSATIPLTWASTDVLYVNFSYPAIAV
jgi:hypothetical protein